LRIPAPNPQVLVEIEQIHNQLNKALPNVKSGTLRFWGEWFGKPLRHYAYAGAL